MNGTTAARFDDRSQPSRRALKRSEIFWAIVSLCLVAAYVNMVVVWRWLEASTNAAVASAIPLVLALSLAGLLAVGHRRPPVLKPLRILVLVLTAAALAVLAWLLIDARFPAKRVHLFEYALLAVVVRQFFRARMAEPLATVAGVVVASLLGAHDELLQGLHPGRFFSPIDVLVNSLSAGAGGALAHAFQPPGCRTDVSPLAVKHWVIVSVAVIALTAFLQILSSVGIDALSIPSLILPSLGLLVWLAIARGDPLNEGRARFVVIAAGLCAAAAVAPSVAILLDLPFA